MRLAVCGFAAFVLLVLPAQAEMSGGKVKIGVLTDLSGPYEQNSGVGSVEATENGCRGVWQHDQWRAGRDHFR
jgi:hypothetical protein